jgi:hypothetical protein
VPRGPLRQLAFTVPGGPVSTGGTAGYQKDTNGGQQ